jgi:hypothetical protein
MGETIGEARSACQQLECRRIDFCTALTAAHCDGFDGPTKKYREIFGQAPSIPFAPIDQKMTQSNFDTGNKLDGSTRLCESTQKSYLRSSRARPPSVVREGGECECRRAKSKCP